MIFASLGPLGGHLGGLLEASWGVLEASWTVLEVSWVVFELTRLRGAYASLRGAYAELTRAYAELTRPPPPGPLDLGRHGNGKSASGTCPRWLMAPVALGSLGAESLLRHRSLLGALVFRDCYVAARSWEPWC